MKNKNIILSALILCSLLLFLFLLVSMDSQKDSSDAAYEEPTSSELPAFSSEMAMTEVGSSESSISDDILTTDESVSFEELTESPLQQELSEDIPPERVSYMPDFYYEPLSDEMINKIYGISYKADCPVPYEDLRYVHILHINFNNEIMEGELICHRDVAQDMVEIFYELYVQNYQIEKVRLIDEYGADDKLSMIDNNTSCFNYRTVEGTNSISKHGLGLAIDINPFYNPYVTKNNDGTDYISPPGSESFVDRNKDFAHKITEDDLCYQLFTEHGFLWGGHWKYTKDYQHFYKEP
ncbi:MAG: M15 family metallopeptidase [Lachnospiraceae bacterium]|nr:M15 family metallopeptidase [Lachnospiraceae bacterium]